MLQSYPLQQPSGKIDHISPPFRALIQHNSIIYYLAGSLGAVSVALALLSRDVTPLMTAHLAVNLNEKQDLIKKEGDYERATTADIK